MSKENMELLSNMSINERLSYAEKLVFGTAEVDLSAGMGVIKEEARNGNPAAEFLMYKVKISKGKVNSAIEWLKKSAAKEYGLAKAMMFYEYCRNNIKEKDETKIVNLLKSAVEQDVPVAYYFMGHIYEKGMFNYNKHETKAKEFFSKAYEFGYKDDFLNAFDYDDGIDAEEEKRDLIAYDLLYNFKYYLAQIVNQNNNFLNKIYKKDEEEFAKVCWRTMLDDIFSPQFKSQKFNDGKGNKYLLIEVPEYKPERKEIQAVYYVVPIDVKGKKSTRIYIGETDYQTGKRILCLVEIYFPNGEMQRRNYGPLVDENNFSSLFSPIPVEEELNVFIRQVIKVYNE